MDEQEKVQVGYLNFNSRKNVGINKLLVSTSEATNL